MPVYETAAELKAAEAAYRRADARERACLATGKPCACIGNHHVPEMHKRGLHLRAENGMFHSGIRTITLFSCRWCGHIKEGHCGGFHIGRGIHQWAPPTEAQLRARKIASGLDPDEFIPLPLDPQSYESDCRCDPGDEDAEPCDEDDCRVAFRNEVGFPG